MRACRVVALYNESRALFASTGHATCARCARSRAAAGRCVLSDGAEVIVGRSDAQPRLARFARLLPQLLGATAARRCVAPTFATPTASRCSGPTRPPRPRPARKACRIAGKYMNRKGDKSLIVGLDIGTSKVTALVGEYSPGSPIEVIGIGSHESRGLKRGVVVDIESTVQSIQRAVEEAELMAGCEIRSVYASISGNHVQCRNSQGIVPIRDGEVTYADLDRVLEAAKAVAIPADQRILHAIPREYVLDDSQEGIRNPVGMTGVRLEVHAHLVVCAQSARRTSASACSAAACRSTT
jgi:hypothetical protein